MRELIVCIGRCLACVFPLRALSLCKSFVMYLRTGYYSFFFKSFGKGNAIRSFSFLRGTQYISIGNRTTIHYEVELTAWDGSNAGQRFEPEIVIGDDCIIRSYSQITAVDSIRIGNGVLTGPNILITDNSHGEAVRSMLDTQPTLRPVVSKGPVVIEDNVWIGTKASIMPGVRIGRGAIVAANSVVTHDVPAYSVVAGCPAVVVKRLGADLEDNEDR